MTTTEKEAIKKHFGVNILLNQLPGKAKILESLKDSALSRRRGNWKNVKDYVRNIIKSKINRTGKSEN